MSAPPSAVRFSFGRRAPSARSWTPGEVRRLRELAMEGLPPSVIARRLGRTESAIRNKAGMQGISLAFRADDSSDAA